MTTTDDLSTTIAHLQDLLTWPDGWNSYDALAPKPEAVSRATTWITEIYEHLQQPWIEPNVTSNADGEPFFSWRHKQRHLEVWISIQDISYLQVWSKGANAKMTDGDITSIEDMLQLWQWLLEDTQEHAS